MSNQILKYCFDLDLIKLKLNHTFFYLFQMVFLIKVLTKSDRKYPSFIW